MQCSDARLLQTTLENIGEGLSVFDGRGQLIVWNARFCELLDLPRDMSAGAPLRDILMLPGDARGLRWRRSRSRGCLAIASVFSRGPEGLRTRYSGRPGFADTPPWNA